MLFWDELLMHRGYFNMYLNEIAMHYFTNRRLPERSIFTSLEEASAFFEKGLPGYSVMNQAGKLDNLELRCRNWKVEPLQVMKAQSSFFDDPGRFPAGSAELDCALLMRAISHLWYVREPFYSTESSEASPSPVPMGRQ